MLRYADCTPVLLADPRQRAVGGGARRLARQRGASGGRRGRGAARRVRQPTRATSWRASARRSARAATWSARTSSRRLRDRPGCFGDGKLDLWEANRQALIEAGVPSEQIEVAGVCTQCESERFFSHRANGGQPAGRFAALIRLEAERAAHRVERRRESRPRLDEHRRGRACGPGAGPDEITLVGGVQDAARRGGASRRFAAGRASHRREPRSGGGREVAAGQAVHAGRRGARPAVRLSAAAVLAHGRPSADQQSGRGGRAVRLHRFGGQRAPGAGAEPSSGAQGRAELRRAPRGLCRRRSARPGLRPDAARGRGRARFSSCPDCASRA